MGVMKKVGSRPAFRHNVFLPSRSWLLVSLHAINPPVFEVSLSIGSSRVKQDSGR